eukprot:scaffold3163_cov60-Attheya_sp.AAC.15
MAMKPMILIDAGREASYDAMMMDLIKEETDYLFEADCYHQTCDKTEIKPSDYHKVEIDDKHTGKKIHLDVRPDDAKPVHQRVFSLAKIQPGVLERTFSRVPRSLEEESSAPNTGVADAFAIELDDVDMLDCFLA